MDGQNKLTAYTIPAHHVTQTNLLKSKPFSPALKEYSDELLKKQGAQPSFNTPCQLAMLC